VEPESNPRVLLVDEHASTRASLRNLLESSGFSVCAEAADEPEAIRAALRERPDICLIDVLLPGSGIDAIAEIAADLPQTAIVVLTASAERDNFFQALRAGACGYLLKGMSPERLPNALRGVLDGEAPIPRALVGSLVSEYQTQGRVRTIVTEHGVVDLSRREWQVLHLMSENLATAAIAECLFISPVTVRRHISSLIAKLGVKDRAGAIALLQRQTS
jgi:DNA-binding NarL/FixJ family response regulator